VVKLLEVKDLQVAFPPWTNPIYPVQKLDLSLDPGQVLGLLGQSGSGKSLSALAIIGMVPRPGKITKGCVLFEGTNLMGLSPSQYRRMRGRDIFIIFQNSGSALTPSMTIGRQLAEIFVHTHAASWRDGFFFAAGLLERVNLESRVLSAYPFELSGGMRQRVLIAMAFALQPKLIIADEPTTGLDMVTQAEILNIFADLKSKNNVSVILITHDLRVMGRLADEVAVMYEGKIVDQASLACLPKQIRHPHSHELLDACQALSSPVTTC
jgi:peptide/nickel transport system ATP-binding protein